MRNDFILLNAADRIHRLILKHHLNHRINIRRITVRISRTKMHHDIRNITFFLFQKSERMFKHINIKRRVRRIFCRTDKRRLCAVLSRNRSVLLTVCRHNNSVNIFRSLRMLDRVCHHRLSVNFSDVFMNHALRTASGCNERQNLFLCHTVSSLSFSAVPIIAQFSFFVENK